MSFLSARRLIAFLFIVCICKHIASSHDTSDKAKGIKRKVLKSDEAPVIRVMTFNLWNSGINIDNGLFKIAKHILYMYPDIVSLQEVTSEAALNNLTRYLGPEWTAIGRNLTRPDSAVLTRHLIIPTVRSPFGYPTPAEENGSTRAKINLSLTNGSSMIVNFWALHLDYHDYGPYAACNKMVTEAYQIDAGEAYLHGDVPGRIQNIHTIVTDERFASDLKTIDREPMLVLGDMNCPSHLDWVESAKHLHCDWVYQWPVSKVLVSLGMRDAFREIYPDPVAVPGFTWSTVQKFEDGYGGTIPEPQDRIDQVFFQSKLLSPVKAKVYSGFAKIQPKPDVFMNDWPSDHASVIVDFVISK